jgi:hypothetical protein
MKSLLLAVLILSGTAWAQKPNKAAEKPSEKKPAKEKVLDFKEQVIEGSIDFKGEETEHKSSPLFLQLGKGDSSVDSIVFKRSNFNDFHEVQMKQRLYLQTGAGK